MKLKRVLYAVAAVTAAVVVAGYAMISSLDVQRVADFARAEVKSQTGRELVIAGPIELKVSLTPSVVLQDLSFANAAWGSRPEMLRIRRLEVEVALLPLLTGDIVVERLIAVAPEALLEINAEGQSNWVFEEVTESAPKPAPGEAASAVALPDLREFRVDGGRLTFRSAVTGEAFEVEIVEGEGSVPAGGGVRVVHIQAAYNGHPFAVDGSYAGVAALLSQTPAPLDLTIAAGNTVVTLKGKAGDLAKSAKADLEVGAKGGNLAELAPFVGGDLPALGPFDLSGNLALAGDTLALSGIALQLGGSDLAGNVELTLAGAPLQLKANLVSKLLDLADFKAAGAADGSAGGATAGGADGNGKRLFPEEPLPVTALNLVNGQVKLSVDRLRLAGTLELEEVATTIVLKDGALRAEPLGARLAGGDVDGRFTIAGGAGAPEIALGVVGRGIDFGDLLKRAEVSDEVGGKLDFDIDVKGQGASPHAIASALDGYVQAVSQEGTIDNALLGVLGAGLGEITGPLFGQSSKARLECFVAGFDIAEGQAASRALVLDAGTFAVAGRGGIDLAAERVNLAFDTQTSQPSLASLAIPFRVTGPLSDPSVVPDPLGAAAGIVDTAGDIAKTGGNLVGDTVNAVGGVIGTGPVIGRIGDGQTLCGAALAALGQAAKPAAKPAPSGAGGVVKSVGDAVKGVGEDIGKGVKSLFGN